MIQANQQSTTIDSWDYWEFQMYIEILNKKNKLKAESERNQREQMLKSQQESQTNTKSKFNMNNLFSKFRK